MDPKVRYAIDVPISGGYDMQLCTCRSPEAAAEVVRMLVAQPVTTYHYVKVVILRDPAPDKAPDSGQPFG